MKNSPHRQSVRLNAPLKDVTIGCPVPFDVEREQTWQQRLQESYEQGRLEAETRLNLQLKQLRDEVDSLQGEGVKRLSPEGVEAADLFEPGVLVPGSIYGDSIDIADAMAVYKIVTGETEGN